MAKYAQDKGPHVGDVGTAYELEVVERLGGATATAVDISGFTELTMRFKLPGGTVVTKTTGDGVALSGDGTDGKFRYVVQVADTIHDAEGTLEVQGAVSLTGGSVFSTDTHELEIYPVLT